MSVDWCPGIREACLYWPHAPMLQQTFAALELSLQEDNDTCIDCAKAIVEVICQMIVAELDSPQNPAKPLEKLPNFGVWVSAAVRALKLGENPDRGFQKLISQHHKLTEVLGELRNNAGPISHGRDGFLNKLSVHHRRAAVLSADAIVMFLHQAYLEADLDLIRTREPYERFENVNKLIDAHVYLEAETDDEGKFNVKVNLPGREKFSLQIDPSRFLYQLDRDAYIEAFNAAKNVPDLLAALREAMARPKQEEK